jgi:hypothetical protein
MRLATATLILVLLSGFSASEGATAEGGDTISYGCSGGFTGGGSGVTVHRDGTVVHWSRPSDRDPVERSLTQHREGAVRLFALFQEVKFESLDFNHPHGNWRCFLTLKMNAREHTVSWGDGRFPIPPEIQRIVDEVEGLRAVPDK